MSDYGSAPPPPPPYGAQGVPGATGAPPPNNLVWGILSTVLCCLPLGIPSIVFATQVNTKWAAGDVAGAQDASDKARKFAIWAAIAGIIGGVLYAIFFFFVLGAAVQNGDTINSGLGY
jgi:Interferon-induced transmembrane protein